MTLVQHPVSPFCIAIRACWKRPAPPSPSTTRQLWDRRPVIALTDGAYSSIPVLVDADRAPAVVVYEPEEAGQDIARYVDARYGLGVFPDSLAGLHDIVVQYVEAQIEDVGFRLNDVYFLPACRTWSSARCTSATRSASSDRAASTSGARRPRRCGPAWGRCWPRWTRCSGAPRTCSAQRPVYADYILYGVLGNYLFTGDNRLPAGLTNLARWHAPAAPPGPTLPGRGGAAAARARRWTAVPRRRVPIAVKALQGADFRGEDSSAMTAQRDSQGLPSRDRPPSGSSAWGGWGPTSPGA